MASLIYAKRSVAPLRFSYFAHACLDLFFCIQMWVIDSLTQSHRPSFPPTKGSKMGGGSCNKCIVINLEMYFMRNGLHFPCL